MSSTFTFLDAVKAKYLETEGDVAADADLLVNCDGQKEMKRWEMVGMDKIKRQTGQLDKLASVAVGDQAFGSVGDAAAIQAVLARLQAVDLSGSTGFTGWHVPCTLADAVPTLRQLDLSRIALGGAEWPVECRGCFKHLTTLILNDTAVQWAELVGLAADGSVDLRGLGSVYLNKNGISSLASPVEVDLGGLFPRLRQVSLIENAVADWAGVVGLLRAVSTVEELVLTGNDLPAPSAEVAAELAGAAALTALSVGDNPRMADISWLKVLGRSESIRALKITYPAVPGTAPNHVRLLAIADMPKITSLNASAVSAKERAEAEKFYTLRAFHSLPPGAKHADDCADLPSGFAADFPAYAGYVQKWGNPSAAADAGKPASSAIGGAATITLRDCCEGKAYRADVTRPLPLAIKVAQVKAVVKAAFGIAPEEQLLVFK
eukprot:gene1227-1902_t